MNDKPLLPLACLSLAVLAVMCVFLTEAPAPTPPPPPPSPLVPYPSAEDSSHLFLTDGGEEEMEPLAISRPLPPKPFKEQKRPINGSCRNARHVAINDGCWRELADKPRAEDGCGDDAYEHGGKCWVWIRERPRTPTSFDVAPPQ